MGKIRGGKGALKASTVEVPAEVLNKVSTLKEEASQLILKKDFNKAAEKFDQAFNLLPAGAADKSELLQKKAFCSMNMKKYKEVVKETGGILEVHPESTSARKTRAKALENLGQYKQALEDIQTVNKTDAANDETRAAEKRLKEAVAGNIKPANPPASAPPAPRQPQTQPAPMQLVIKASLGNDTRIIRTPLSLSYGDLLKEVKSKFPHAGPFILKAAGKGADDAPIKSRGDIQGVFAQSLLEFQRAEGANAPKLLQQLGFPPLKIQVVKVGTQEEVPKVPIEEIYPSLAKEAAVTNGQSYEPEEWLLEFSQLFTEVTGLENSAALESDPLGSEKLQFAISQTLAHEKASPLFDLAGEQFRDSVVTSYIQWGNAFIVRADRILQSNAKEDKILKGKELNEVMGLYNETQKKIEEGLKVKPDSWEAVGALAQLEWERAKAKLGYIIVPQVADESGQQQQPEKAAEELQKNMLSQLADVLAKISKHDVKQVGGHMKAVNEKFDAAFVLAKKHFEGLRFRRTGTAKQDGGLEFGSAPSNVLVMHGNILYDWSQVLAQTEAEPWRPALDKAVEKFKESAAPEADIRAALKNHMRKEELDLGPDPAPEPDAQTAATAAAAPASKADAKAAQAAPEVKEAKGLPALERKGGKGGKK